MWPFTSNKPKYQTNESPYKRPTPSEYKQGIDTAWDYHKYFTEELIEWFAKETDAYKLAVAYCCLICWGWAEFMPKPEESFDIKTHGYGSNGKVNSYSMIRFAQILAKDLKLKAERISPGTTQQVWMSQVYNKYNLFPYKPEVK